MKRSPKLTLLAALAVVTTSSLIGQGSPQHVSKSKTANAKEWIGERLSGARSQEMVLHLPTSGSGTIDLPDFGATGIPATNLKLTANTIHFELIGDSSKAVFDGKVDSAAIRGHWSEGEHSGEFALHSSGGEDAGSVFSEKSLSIQNGEVHLMGTLVMPYGTGPFPVVIFVQGAGPETRSSSSFLATYFARRGIAAFIYDKRGSGESSGDWKHSSFETLAGDVEAVVKFIGSEPGINARHIGLMGSSQGGWIAPMAALHLPDLAFVISKSAAPITPEKQELGRVSRWMTEQGASPDDVAEGQKLYKNVIAYARSGAGWEQLQQELKVDSAKPWAFFPADTPKDFYFFDQIRLFFAHDPIPVLQQLRCPLLVIFGGKDDDAPPLDEEVGPLLSALQTNGEASQVEIFPNAGHDIRVLPDPKSWDFARFAPGYIPLLGAWVDAALRIR